MEVGKQNDFYQQLVAYALPVEIQNIYGEFCVILLNLVTATN